LRNLTSDQAATMASAAVGHDAPGELHFRYCDGERGRGRKMTPRGLKAAAWYA